MHMHKLGEGKRERERKSQADSAPSAKADVGLDLVTLRSRPKQKPRVGHLYLTELSGAPKILLYLLLANFKLLKPNFIN